VAGEITIPDTDPDELRSVTLRSQCAWTTYSTRTGHQRTCNQDTVHEIYIAAKTKHKQKHYGTQYNILQYFKLLIKVKENGKAIPVAGHEGP
jgi:hypothetical protein